MVYNPPRDPNKRHTKKGQNKHTSEQDVAFLQKRLKELQKLYDRTPERDRSRRAYYNGQIKSLERRLNPHEATKPKGEPKPRKSFANGVDDKGQPYADAGNSTITGDVDKLVK